jgi:hypothetical protein
LLASANTDKLALARSRLGLAPLRTTLPNPPSCLGRSGSTNSPAST